MHSLTLLHSRIPLLLGLGILLNLLLHHLHHLLILLHHLCPHISIRSDIFLDIPINPWPASSSSSYLSQIDQIQPIQQLKTTILDSKKTTSWIVFLMTQGTI